MAKPDVIVVCPPDRDPPPVEKLRSEAEFIVALQRPNGAARLSAADGALLAEASYSSAECENPSEPQILPDGRLFLVCEGDHYARGALVQLDPATLAIVQRVELGLYPERMAVVLP